MPSFSSLPDEILRNHILSRFSVFPPDEYALAYRAVCRKVYKMVPLEDVLSIDRDTARWLLGGRPVEWKESMNTAVLYSHYSDERIYIGLQGSPFTPPNCMVLNNEDHVYFDSMSGIMMRRLMTRGINNSESIIEIDVPNLVTSCTLFRNKYFLLINGIILKTWVSSSDKRSKQRFKDMSTRHQKQITVPDRSKDATGEPAFKKMVTVDGHVFWFQNNAGDLDVINWQGSDEMIQVATAVKMFQLINNAAVYVTTEGNLRLINLKIKGKTMVHFTTSINIMSVSQFKIMPSIKSLWTITSSQKLIRHRGPFIIPNNNILPRESVTYFSANALHAKIVQMQAKLKTADMEK
jgi:hypothetical protein